jgi:hemerythrin superfamily protein
VDAIVMLKEDHKMVEKLFKQFEKAADDAYAEKEQIVEQVILALTQHSYVEETIFYPTAREAVPQTAKHVLESIEEHHVVMWMLSELSNTDSHDERFDAKMTVLMENVRHHVEEEEQEWFPRYGRPWGAGASRNWARRWRPPRATHRATRFSSPALTAETASRARVGRPTTGAEVTDMWLGRGVVRPGVANGQR